MLFDRSWYNRAGVERVMGFASPTEYEQFMAQAPLFERMIVDSGMSLTKLWFSVTQAEQRTRFIIRQVDPVRQWKLSPIDLESLDKWEDYTAAKEAMIRRTDTEWAPWTTVKSNDKKRARVNAMRAFLSRFDYDGKDADVVGVARPAHRAARHRRRRRLTAGSDLHGPAPRLLVDAVAVDPPVAQVGEGRVGVVDDDLDELRGAVGHHVEPGPEADRARGAGRRHLHEPQVGRDHPVMVDVPAQAVAVERDRPVDVRDGQRHQLDPEVHVVLLRVGPPSGPRAPTVGGIQVSL